MLARQRQSKILREIDELGSVEVSRLAADLAVTDETIRRDLSKLAGEGLVVRTHGGAMRPDPDGRDAPLAQRRITNVEEKRAIAIQAISFVSGGDVIALDASTTAYEFARQLTQRHFDESIFVVSNSLEVAKLMAGRPGITFVSTGGEIDPDGACFTGTLAETTIRQFSFTRAFMSCKAYDVERGPGEALLSHAAIKRAMIKSADEAILLVDSSKLTAKSACVVAPPERFARLITDSVEGAARLSDAASREL